MRYLFQYYKVFMGERQLVLCRLYGDVHDWFYRHKATDTKKVRKNQLTRARCGNTVKFHRASSSTFFGAGFACLMR
jgi:hypothetical protein